MATKPYKIVVFDLDETMGDFFKFSILLGQIEDYIGKKLTTIPVNFQIHSTIKKIIENKKKMFDTGGGFDWATAESFAFGTLLYEGFPVRIVGQDTGRGTFSQRHSVLRDQNTGETFIPLNQTIEG